MPPHNSLLLFVQLIPLNGHLSFYNETIDFWKYSTYVK